MPEKHFPTTRLEAFTDGVLAIVLTIMVLELKVPHENGMGGLLSLAPIVFVYFLSFCFIGIYWVNHHYLIRRVERCDHRVLYANLFFLFGASLIPFFTAYVIEKESDSFSVSLYAASMIFTGLTFFVLRISVDRLLKQEGRLIPSDSATQRKHVFSLMLYAAAIPLAHYHSYLALGLITIVTILWIVPAARHKNNLDDVAP